MPHALPEARPGERASARYEVCFVCTGNICRSPMAAVVFADVAGRLGLDDASTLGDRVSVSSAGTGNWHVGEGMDPRARAALTRRGYHDDAHVASHISAARLAGADLVVALDRRHQQTLRGLGRQRVEGRVVLLRSFDRGSGGALDVPDPFYDDEAFDPCLAMIEAGCRGLARALAEALGAPER